MFGFLARPARRNRLFADTVRFLRNLAPSGTVDYRGRVTGIIKVRSLAWVGLLVVLGGNACRTHDEQAAHSDAGPLTLDTIAEKWAQLGRDHGCTQSSLDPNKVPAQCYPAVVTWFDCVAKDKAQCICESDDGNLNCEGSWKPNEGPARCIAEHTAFVECSQ
jgi:hypothetical protein